MKPWFASEESIKATLHGIDPEMPEEYLLTAMKRLRKDRFYASLRLNDREFIDRCYKDLKEVKGVSLKERLVRLMPDLYLRIRKR